MKRHLAAALIAVLALASHSRAEDKDPASITAKTVVHQDGTRTEVITNTAERTSEERLVNAAGKLMRRTVYTLDDFGQTNGGVVYDTNNRPVSRFQLVRNTLGLITEQRDYTVSGEPYQRRIFRHGSDGKVTGVDTYDGKGNLVHTTGTPSRRQPQNRR